MPVHAGRLSVPPISSVHGALSEGIVAAAVWAPSVAATEAAREKRGTTMAAFDCLSAGPAAAATGAEATVIVERAPALMHRPGFCGQGVAVAGSRMVSGGAASACSASDRSPGPAAATPVSATIANHPTSARIPIWVYRLPG